MQSFFVDKTIWDGGSKSAISVRDGVLEYLGAEIGADEPNKIYKVYRSPATISNAAAKMVGIPLTEDHVDLSSSPAGVGVVKSSEMIDFFEDGTDSALAIKNTVDLKQEILDTLSNGKRELSLGYTANLVPHSKYDYEQRDVEPHHLAIVDAGRCGHGCSFLDNGRAIILHKLFCDEDGKLNLSKIAEITMALPDAIKAMPIDKLAKIMPKLQEIVEMSKSKEVKDASMCGNCEHADGCSAKMKRCIEHVEEQGKSKSSATAICKMSAKDQYKKEGNMPEKEKDLKKKEDEVKDQDPKEEDGKEVKDQDEEKEDKEDKKDEEKKQEAKDAKINICDTKEFKDAVASAIKAHGAVISKAVNFVDEGYDFSSKTTDEIMSDAVSTQYDIKDMAPEEIKVAFKLLKKESNYKNFGDQNTDDVWSKLSKKEL